MVTSIRRFLLINLLLSITIITLLSTVITFYLDRKDIESHFNTQLMQITLAIQAIILPNIDTQNVAKLQKQINQIPAQLENIASEQDPEESKTPSFQFQIWDDKGNLLLRSKEAPDLPLSSGRIGLTSEYSKNQQWRIFTFYNEDTGYTTVVTQRYEIWNKLATRIARDDSLIILVVYPLLGVLIWLIVSKGLRPLKRITFEVSHRASSYLEPVSVEAVPNEIKPLIEELNYLFERLKEAFEREKRFTSDAAHELKTPLAVLKTQAQLALHTSDDKERTHALQKLIASVDRGTHAVQQLLTLSRMQPMQTEEMHTVNLHQIAVETIAELVPLALEKNIDIELVADETSYLVKGLPVALSILLRNLIDNAIRYTPQGGFVKVQLAHEQQQIILQVIDNGLGINKALRERVFERFFRVLGTKSAGSGLGLAIVQQIATMHQATISLEDGPEGVGLQVTLRFGG